jgi:hypothetical membrane protein
MKDGTGAAGKGFQGREALLLCGIASAFIYVLTDIAAAKMYAGFSYTDQAVSELFAIGAPTSRFVVLLFSLSSALMLLFALGIACSSDGKRVLRILAMMFAASAADALALWNIFPMHMRGTERTFTDTIHLILATNPFVLATLVIGILAFKGRFRWISIFTLAAILLLASFGFHYAAAIDSGEPTPGLGLSERLGQYIYQGWQTVLALQFLNSAKSRTI